MLAGLVNSGSLSFDRPDQQKAGEVYFRILAPISGGAIYDRAHEVEPDVGQCPLARGRGRNRLGGHVRRAGDGADAIVRATKLGTQPMTRNRCSIPRPLSSSVSGASSVRFQVSSFLTALVLSFRSLVFSTSANRPLDTFHSPAGGDCCWTCSSHGPRRCRWRLRGVLFPTG
jgi:hypothetical protein